MSRRTKIAEVQSAFPLEVTSQPLVVNAILWQRLGLCWMVPEAEPKHNSRPEYKYGLVSIFAITRTEYNKEEVYIGPVVKNNLITSSFLLFSEVPRFNPTSRSWD